MLGNSFSDYPMGSAWEAASQDERDKFIRVAIGRLSHYGLTLETELENEQEAALANYIRFIFERDGSGSIEPPNYVINALQISRTNRPGSFALEFSNSPTNDGAVGTGGISEDEAAALIDESVADWAETDNDDPIPENKLINAPVGGGDGLNQNEVDARITQNVEEWALNAASESGIPFTKIDSGELQAEIIGNARDEIADWAENSNTDPIPADKLVNAPSGSEGSGLTPEQVDARIADWAETANSDSIPASKLDNVQLNIPTQVYIDNLINQDINSRLEPWAEIGVEALIPASKLINAPIPVFGNGERQTPSITFSSDLNTGFFRQAENVIGISAGGQLAASISTASIILNSPAQLAAGSTIDGQPIGTGGGRESTANVGSSLTGVLFLEQADTGDRRVELVGTTLSFINFPDNEKELLRFRLKLGKVLTISDSGQGFSFLITGPVTEQADRFVFEYLTIQTIGNGNITNGSFAIVNFLADTFAIQEWAREGNNELVPATKLPVLQGHQWRRVHSYRLNVLNSLGGANAPNVQDRYELWDDEGRQAYLEWFRPNTTKEYFAILRGGEDETLFLGSFFGVLDNTPDSDPDRITVVHTYGFDAIESITDTQTDEASIFFEFRLAGRNDADLNIPLIIGFPYLTGAQSSPFTTEVVDFYVREAINSASTEIIEPWAVSGNTTAIPAEKLTNAPVPEGGRNSPALVYELSLGNISTTQSASFSSPSLPSLPTAQRDAYRSFLRHSGFKRIFFTLKPNTNLNNDDFDYVTVLADYTYITTDSPGTGNNNGIALFDEVIPRWTSSRIAPAQFQIAMSANDSLSTSNRIWDEFILRGTGDQTILPNFSNHFVQIFVQIL